MKKKKQEEEAKRLAEIERLKKERKAIKIAEAKKDIRKYKEIISSPYGRQMKDSAWKVLQDKYPEAEGLNPGDTFGLLARLRGILESFANSIGMKFVFIKPGTFMMGSPSSEDGSGGDEKQHKVSLSRGYDMQTTEVTQGQWREIMGNNPSSFKNCGDDCPVENVSWNDIQEFIRKLNQKEGTNEYRLPTEAEWEYACRAGSKTRFYFGDSNGSLEQYAWYNSNSSSKTHPVAKKKPNAWGLYDMHGNVWEWCQGWKGDYPSGHVTDPDGPSSGSRRVVRGGSWVSPAGYCRSANRDPYSPGVIHVSLGIRLARTF